MIRRHLLCSGFGALVVKSSVCGLLPYGGFNDASARYSDAGVRPVTANVAVVPVVVVLPYAHPPVLVLGVRQRK